MELGERIKKVRKELNLTQQIFSDRIGLKRNSLALIEAGRNPSEQTLTLICRTFRVNEEWLREGKGEMFLPEDDALLLEDPTLDNIDKTILKAYIALPPEVRKVIKDFTLNIAAKVAAAEKQTSLASAQEEVTAENITPEEKEIIKKFRIEKNEKKIKIKGDISGGTFNF